MSAILKRLERYEKSLSHLSKKSELVFADELAEKNINFFRQLVRDHTLLSFEYRVCRTRLASYPTRFQDNTGDLNLITQVRDALAMAELLEIINRDYLKVPREIIRLRRDQAVYRTFLEKNGYYFKSSLDSKFPEFIFEVDQPIHHFTTTLNWTRLGMQRFRKLVVATIPLADELPVYRFWLERVEKVAKPVVAHVAWIFFTPRLFINLAMFTKHTLPGCWMDEKEYQLGWKTRFKVEWDKRWFEMGNDITSLITGWVNCFVLIGNAAPLSLYMSITLQAFDLIWASIRVIKEISHLNTLTSQFQHSNKDDEEQLTYQRHLTQLIAHEQKKLLLIVINTGVLLLGLSLSLPVIAFDPLMPLAGAVLASLMTISCFAGTKYLEKNKPSEDITLLEKEKPTHVRQSFFNPKEDSQPDIIPTNTALKNPESRRP